MSNRLSYIKKFIIFKDDYSNMKNLKSKGHGKLEVKGNNLNISLNIKGAETNNFYNVDLIKRRENYTLGRIFTKEDKSGEREIDINYRELEKNGFSLDEVDGIIIYRDSNVLLGEKLKGTGKNLRTYIEGLEREKRVPKEEPVLREESQDEIKTEKENMEDTKIIEEVELIEDAEDDIYPDEIEKDRQPSKIEDRENIETELEAEKENINEEDSEELAIKEAAQIEDSQEGISIEYVEEAKAIEEAEEEELKGAEEFEEPQEEVEGLPIQDEENEKSEFETLIPYQEESIEEADDVFSEKMYEEIMEEIFNIPELGYENNIDIDESDIKDKNKAEADEMSEYLKNILNFFPQSEPFTVKLEGYDWWKIEMEEKDEDKSFLPYFSYIIGGNNKPNRLEEEADPKKLLNRYRHYIFGLYNEGEGVKFYMYGIPGRFSLEDYPRGGSTGFNTWFEGVEVPGYWVLYIEPQTGKILYPINPMIPKS